MAETNEEQRIRLAEAMGWIKIQERTMIPERAGLYGYPGAHHSQASLLPDPFTDANDDYAVLQWARANWRDEVRYHDLWDGFYEACPRPSVAYHVGDYARAALKVLDGV